MEIAIKVSREVRQYGVIQMDDAEILQDASVEAVYDHKDVVITLTLSVSDIVENHEDDIDWDDATDDGDIEIDEVEAS